MTEFLLNPQQSSASENDQMVTSAEKPYVLIKSTDTDHFVTDVIEPSSNHPVIVLFSTPHHATCLSLETVLETLVNRAGGLVCLAKVSIDENQQLAQQLRIQSVPTVFAFQNGQAVDAFSGLQSEVQVQAFITKLIGDAKPPLEIAMDHAQEAMDERRWSDAEAIYADLFEQDASFAPTVAGLIKAMTAQGQFDRGQEFISGLDISVKNSVIVAGAISGFELALESKDAPNNFIQLQQLVASNANNFDARFDLAKVLFAQNQLEPAIDHLLEIVRLNRSWNDDCARKQLVKIFDAVGPNDPIIIESRKRLSAVLFS